VIQRGRSLSVVEVAVSDADGSPVARALVTYRLSLPTEAPA
jgi:acyl-coenzyme A thioesterase PaaI-like protein